MSASHLIDTDNCVELFRERNLALRERFASMPAGACGISVITYFELVHGAAKGSRMAAEIALIEQLRVGLPVWSLGPTIAIAYGETRADLARRGEAIGALDTLIAAHALALNLILVTNNTREFSRVRGLKVENWLVKKR